MSTETIFPSLSRTKRFTINWSNTVTPVKNFQYFFGFDQEVKDGLLTGLQPEVATVQPVDINFSNFNGVDTNDDDFLKFAYITLLNDKGEMVVDSIPVLSLFNANNITVICNLNSHIDKNTPVLCIVVVDIDS